MYRLQHVKRFSVGLLGARIATPCGERHFDIQTGGFDRLLQADITRQHDHVGHARTAVFSNRFEHRQNFSQPRRLIAFPVFLRSHANTRTVRTTAHIRATVGSSTVPRSIDQLTDAQTRLRNASFHRRHVVIGATGRNGILPNQIFRGHFRADVT